MNPDLQPALKQSRERATVENMHIDGIPDDATRRVLAEYFSHFYTLPPEEECEGFLYAVPCVNCGKGLAGFCGTFQWGLAHGEGACTACGWPGRGCHYIKLPDGRTWRLGGPQAPYVLQYHEDDISPESLEGLRANAAEVEPL